MTRLDLTLAALVALAIVAAAVLTALDKVVPDLVEYAGFTCLGGIARGHVARVRGRRYERNTA